MQTFFAILLTLSIGAFMALMPWIGSWEYTQWISCGVGVFVFLFSLWGAWDEWGPRFKLVRTN